MSTKIINLPITKGIISVTNVWKTKLKIKFKDEYFTINTPKDMARASAGDVFHVEKVTHTQNGFPSRRLIARKIKTTSKELLPLKNKKMTKIVKKGNGLLKIEIDGIQYVILERDIVGVDSIEEGDVIELIAEYEDSGYVSIQRFIEGLSEEELFT